MELRDYQSECVERNLLAMERGVKATLNALFTGAGKTVIFVTMASRIPGKTLIICPMRELVWQAAEKVRQLTDDFADLEMADYVADGAWSKIVVASKQTLLSRRGGEQRYRKFDNLQLVIVDEAHAMCSPAVVEMLRYFQDTGAMVCGFTATPFRMDGKALVQ